jgi:predicted DCC family thiol-disulfide oxidoreductase YuxK
MTETPHPVVLFDGVCNFCQASVRFIIRRDPQGVFRFAALQSPFGQDLLKKFRLRTDELTTMVLVEGDSFFTRSTAALRIARRLKAPWPIFYALIVLPLFLRDFFYALIAKHRYRWFGKKEECMIPTPEIRSRFLG